MSEAELLIFVKKLRRISGFAEPSHRRGIEAKQVIEEQGTTAESEAERPASMAGPTPSTARGDESATEPKWTEKSEVTLTSGRL